MRSSMTITFKPDKENATSQSMVANLPRHHGRPGRVFSSPARNCVASFYSRDGTWPPMSFDQCGVS
jgi:hypothetical protein